MYRYRKRPYTDLSLPVKPLPAVGDYCNITEISIIKLSFDLTGGCCGSLEIDTQHKNTLY